jgi:hypothetical protein
VAHRDGDELVVLHRTTNVVEWAMSSDVSGAPERGVSPCPTAVLLASTMPGQIVIVGLNYHCHVEEPGQPGGAGPPERGIYPVATKDRPHRGGCHLIAMAYQLALNAPATPLRGPLGQAQNAAGDAGRGRGRPRLLLG